MGIAEGMHEHYPALRAVLNIQVRDGRLQVEYRSRFGQRINSAPNHGRSNEMRRDHLGAAPAPALPAPVAAEPIFNIGELQ